MLSVQLQKKESISGATFTDLVKYQCTLCKFDGAQQIGELEGFGSLGSKSKDFGE